MSLATFKILLSMHAADLDVQYHHGDVTAAFVSAKMRREAYSRLPSHLCSHEHVGKIFKVVKALYGGVDAGRCFMMIG